MISELTNLFGFRELAVDIRFDSFALPLDGSVHHKHDAAVALVMVVEPQATPARGDVQHSFFITVMVNWSRN